MLWSDFFCFIVVLFLCPDAKAEKESSDALVQ